MIHWKLHDPRFEVRLANPQGFGYDVWSWEGGQGWIDYIDVEDFLEFSEPFALDAVAKEIRTRLLEAEYPDTLVLYCPEPEGIRISLVGALDQHFLQGIGGAPPDWWSSTEGETFPLQHLLDRVQTFIEVISQFFHRKGIRSTQHLQTDVVGFCSVCGLTEEHHVSHEVPGFPRDVLATLTTPQAARPFLLAFRHHYGSALQKMRDEEMLAMPLPPNKRYLRAIEADLKRRMSEPPASPVSAIERLLTDSLLGDEAE